MNPDEASPGQNPPARTIPDLIAEAKERLGESEHVQQIEKLVEEAKEGLRQLDEDVQKLEHLQRKPDPGAGG
jgi:hypothetical protein